MPHIRYVPMRSVVYVIIEDRESHEIVFSPAILIDVVEISTGGIDFKVELLDKCGIHQAYQYVSVHDKDIFSTLAECKAVYEDRQTRLEDANKTSEDLNKQIKNLCNMIKNRDEQHETMHDQIEKMKLEHATYMADNNHTEMAKVYQAISRKLKTVNEKAKQHDEFRREHGAEMPNGNSYDSVEGISGDESDHEDCEKTLFYSFS